MKKGLLIGRLQQIEKNLAFVKDQILDLVTDLNLEEREGMQGCPNCNRTGMHEDQTCTFCDGEGEVHESVFS